jgi:hypothetical protein
MWSELSTDVFRNNNKNFYWLYSREGGEVARMVMSFVYYTNKVKELEWLLEQK